MRLKRTLVMAAAVIAAAGVGAGLGLGTGGPARAAARTAAGAPPVVGSCAGKPLVKPSSYVLTCADYGMMLSGAHWASWTPRLASGYGTWDEKLCVPDCAAGKTGHYPVDVVLWGGRVVSGREHYAHLTVIYTGASRPPVYQSVNGKAVATYPVTFTLAAQ